MLLQLQLLLIGPLLAFMLSSLGGQLFILALDGLSLHRQQILALLELLHQFIDKCVLLVFRSSCLHLRVRMRVAHFLLHLLISILEVLTFIFLDLQSPMDLLILAFQLSCLSVEPVLLLLELCVVRNDLLLGVFEAVALH